MEFRGIPPMKFEENVAEAWKLWKQRFQKYLTATELSKKDGETKCAQLLTLIGEEGMRIYNTFEIPNDKENDLDTLLKFFDQHCLPKKNLTFVRHKFLNCKQKATQTIERYVIELKNLAKECELGALQDSLTKDVLICGIKSASIREKLLQRNVANLEEAVQLCITTEFNREHNQKISSASNNVNKRIYDVQANDTVEDIMFVGSLELHGIEDISAETWVQEMEIEGRKVLFKLDTGAMANVLPVEILQSIGCNYTYQKFVNNNGRFSGGNLDNQSINIDVQQNLLAEEVDLNFSDRSVSVMKEGMESDSDGSYESLDESDSEVIPQTIMTKSGRIISRPVRFLDK
ncbi:hypothetical protein NQ315_017562 [Exocentrus adspersus]|uniref:Retrotransposon gag domain-containing protein n=1 Tax=Exocentrus adspersus TaxID=1586481 RepID=A0AAV8VIK4_9CUCU|nr:hypothetical protein NQ315_017562 [Exocentrus adspersus]